MFVGSIYKTCNTKIKPKMVRITEKLLRKKSEHNELMISTLEEVSLHQEDIECIEHIQNWCRDLKILLLQSNVIARIENVHKLKRLEYLNLAVNNIERIENLEHCESLQKLDLTLNFIGELTSIESLRDNFNFRELILTGNPCAEYEGYRDYVVATLPQLQKLDCAEITDTMRLQAKQSIELNRKRIVQLQAEYQVRRDDQKLRILADREKDALENEGLDEDARNTKFWNKTSEHCPETRLDIVNQQRKSKNVDAPLKEPKKQSKLFADCGRPYSINHAKLEFNFVDELDRFELNLHVYKYLETSLIEVDVQPNYVRATVKGKVFQMALSSEVLCSAATSQRSMITGHLLIVMPKMVGLTQDHMLTINKCLSTQEKVEAAKSTDDKKSVDVVDYKHIVNEGRCVDDNPDVPALVW